MNEDIVKGKWKELRGKVRERWGKITGDDIDRLKGSSDELIGLLQQRYGYEREQAHKEIQEWAKRY
ncbi:MAG: CsbD family protein [Pseudomonadota bacterium]|nr:CsbD family protein [Pseudomonadota bacterium]